MGGPIGAIRDRDIIQIDIPAGTLNVRLEQEEIAKKLQEAKFPERKLTPLLKVYRERFKGVNCYGK